jgi:hypothetical protein
MPQQASDQVAHINLYVPRELADELRRLASDAERTLSGEVRLALREHIDRQRRREREAVA